MSNLVDVSALSADLQKSKKEYEKIFGLKMASGFEAKKDFVVLGIDQEIELIRDELGNITQPGRTGVTNFSTGFIGQKARIGKLKPAKVDLKFTEEELYKLRVSYLGRREPGDPRDINSLAGRNYIMGRVYARIGKEVNRAIFKGVENRATGATGGLNLFDGLGFKVTEGYTTVASGGKEDIPAGNKVGSAVTISEATVIGEVSKMVDLIVSNEDLVEYMEDSASFFVNPQHFVWINNALDSALSNGSRVVTKRGNQLFLNALPNTEIKPRTWMIGVNNMLWTLDGNLFYLHQDVETDIPNIKFQEVDRDLKILIDFEVNVEYADGRLIVLLK